MGGRPVSEATIRQYLLGILPAPALAEIEQELFLSEELSQTASLIEDEIIDQYLHKELDPRERNAVETYFLRSLAHRDELRFAGLLGRRLEPSASQHSSQSQIFFAPPRGRLIRYRFWQAYSAFAAIAVLGGSSLYLGIALHYARIQNATLAKQVQQQTGSQTPSVELSLPYGVALGGDALPQIVVLPATRNTKVELELPGSFAESYNVRLLDHRHTEEPEIWAKNGLKPDSSKLRLVFDMPSQGMRSGIYDLVVSNPSGGSSVIYPFNVKVIPPF
jgi:hypothetical protein